MFKGGYSNLKQNALFCSEGVLLSPVPGPSSYLNLLLKDQNWAKPSKTLSAAEEVNL